LGPHVDRFESELAEFVGVDHAVALSSGTAALHLALLGVGVQQADEVVVASMTFAATAFATTYVGATPIFVDSEPDSWNIDPDLLLELLTSRARAGRLPAAVVAVDVFGQPADYDRITTICAEFDVPLIEDAAESLGAQHTSGAAGSFGAAAVFSFNGNKIMTTSGGGMLVTNSAELANRARYLATQARQPVPWYEHTDIGFNYRMSNILAALGCAQLARLPDMIETRRAHRKEYSERLAPLGVRVVPDAPWGTGNAWLTVVVFDDDAAPVRVRERLAAEGIESRPVWKPMHRQPVFAQAEASTNGTSDDLFARGLCLPSGSDLSAEDRQYIVELIGAEVQAS
jgi:dTDP-4-amino-4,6-dideoxygalactose transaminase